MTKPNMSDNEYAVHRHVTRQSVERWRKRGYLVTHPDGGIHVIASDAILNSRPKIYRGGQASKPLGESAESPAAQDFSDLAAAPLSECIRRKEAAIAATREIALERLRGNIVLAEHIEPRWSRIILAIRNQMLSIPGRARLTMQLTAEQAEALRKLIHDALTAAATADISPRTNGEAHGDAG